MQVWALYMVKYHDKEMNLTIYYYIEHACEHDRDQKLYMSLPQVESCQYIVTMIFLV